MMLQNLIDCKQAANEMLSIPWAFSEIKKLALLARNEKIKRD